MSKTTIWARLKEKGFSDTACAAIMGNMQQESAFRSNNVEDRSGIPDETYTAQVDNGSYSRHQFLSDAYGYGLCQWTYYTRKIALYDLAKSRGVSVADEQMQIDLLVQELQSDYMSVYDVLMSGASLYDMTAKFMRSFENPADQSAGAINYRVGLAQAIYQEFAGTVPDIPSGDGTEPSGGGDEPEGPDTPATPFWPPRVICKGMVGSDVAALQALLIAHGYNCDGIDGDFGLKTNNMLMAYQAENGLAADGIAGRYTWGRLLQL